MLEAVFTFVLCAAAVALGVLILRGLAAFVATRYERAAKREERQG